MHSDDIILQNTRNWLEKAVIGLNLCPFAKSVYVKNQVKLQISRAQTDTELIEELAMACAELSRTPPQETDTILLIHPWVLTHFDDYNRFLDIADQVLEELELEGELQIASFHPDYLFADAPEDDISHYTNRSPYPILHLLREDSIDKAVTQFPDASRIYEHNIETLHKLGLSGWQTLFERQDG